MMSSKDQRKAKNIFDVVRVGNFDCLTNLIDSGVDLSLKDKNGMHVLHVAAAEGQIECLTVLISREVTDLNERDSKGNTALHSASSRGHVECVGALISSGANVEEKNMDGQTALTVAVRNGHGRCLIELLNAGASFDLRDECDKATLCDAARNRHLECVVSLMEKRCVSGEDDINEHVLLGLQYMSTVRANALCAEQAEKDAESGLEAGDVQGRSALFYASILGQPECLRTLIDIGIDVNLKQHTEHTPLFAATFCGNTECADILLRAGADVNFTDREGKSALSSSAGNGYNECIKALIDAGADVNLTDSQGETAIFLPAFLGQEDCLKMLIEAGADVNVQNEQEETVIFKALRQGHFECVDIIIQAGANVNARDIDGHTPLTCGQCVESLIYAGANIYARSKYNEKPFVEEAHVRLSMHYYNVSMNDTSNTQAIVRAAWHGHQELIASFIASGADVNVREDDGTTALIAAAWEGHVHCINTILLASNIDVNAQDFCNRTALYASSCDGHIECVERLLAHRDVVVDLPNMNGVTPVMVAAEKWRKDCVKVLIAAGANVKAMDNSHHTPLAFAASGGSIECLQMVLQATCLVGQSVSSQEFLPILSSAVSRGNFDCVKILSQYAPDSLKSDDKSQYLLRSCTMTRSRNQRLCLPHLIKAGIFQWRWYPKLIADRNILLRELVISGITPGYFLDSSLKPCTPLIYALRIGDCGSVRYVMANLYLTPLDISILQNDSNFSKLIQKRSDQIKQLYNKHSTTPWRLEILAFIEISAMLKRNQPFHEEENLSWAKLTNILPEKFVARLNFKHPIRQLCILDWRKIDGDFLNLRKRIVWPREEELKEHEKCDFCGSKCVREG